MKTDGMNLEIYQGDDVDVELIGGRKRRNDIILLKSQK